MGDITMYGDFRQSKLELVKTILFLEENKNNGKFYRNGKMEKAKRERERDRDKENEGMEVEMGERDGSMSR